jgi:hypothetical protein
MQVHTQNFSFGGGGRGAEPEAIYNLCLIFKSCVIKIMSQVQHNTVCNCIYIHTNITTRPITQSQCPIFLFFFINLFFKILMH